MIASSHQSPGPLPGPVPLQQAPVAQATPAAVNPDVPASLVVHRAEPLLPQCFDCGTRKGPLTPCPQGRRYPSGGQVLHCPAHRPATTPVQAAVGVMSAELREGPRSVAELAQAEQDAGLLFDPRRAKDIADAAYEQAKAENAAELAQAQQDREARDWFHARWKAVNRLLAGRPADDLMFVHEVLAAADPKARPGAPLSLFWDGLVMGPSGDTERENTLVPCTTAHGAQAFLVLDDERRLALGGLLLATVHTAEACTTPGCGTSADDTDASNPFLFGWILLDVAGTEDGPRWWCSPGCVHAALTAAGAELAAVDQGAAVDPDQQAPGPLYGGDPLAYGPTGIPCGCGKDAHSNLVPCQPDTGGRRYFTADDPPGEDDTEPDFHRIDDDEPHCVRCGCSARRPCAGGCHWVPNAGLVDLCSRCASPEDITPAPIGGGL